MAGNEANFEIGVEYTAKGSDQLIAQIGAIADLLDDFSRRGEVSEQTADAVGKAFVSMAQAAGKVATGLNKSNKAASDGASDWDKFRASVLKTDKALGEAMKTAAVDGAKNPFAEVSSGITDSQIDDFEAMQIAQTSALQRASKDRTAARRAEAAEQARIEKHAVDTGNAQLQYEAKQRAEFIKRRTAAQDAAAKLEQKQAQESAAMWEQVRKRNVSNLEAEAKESNRQMEARVKAQQAALPKGQYDAHVQEYKRLTAAQKENADTVKFQSLTYQEGVESMNALRYASYDMGRTLLTVSAGLAAAGVAAGAAFASQERAFTEVERIVEGDSKAIQTLRDELTALSTEIPRSFQDLSGIASLGAALGIASGELDEFTAVVAKFSTLTGVTEDAAATGFGRIAQYLQVGAEEFDSLGSAILKAGNISVATEEQVLKFSQAIALPAARTGLLADEVVALGAATASFANINVEGAGSAFSRVFGNIERQVAMGGEALDKFAATAGMSSAAFRTAWGSEAGNTFNKILQGLATDTANLTTNLDALGVRNERDRRVVSALVLNYGEYQKILGSTTAAWREGIYMNESYGLVLDDLMSKWTLFVNALTNAAAAVGSQVAPAMKDLLDVAVVTLVALSDFASSDAGGAIIRIASAVGIMVGAFTAVRGVIALATGAALAFRFALSQGVGASISSGISGLLRSLGMVNTSLSINTAQARIAGASYVYLTNTMNLSASAAARLSRVVYGTVAALKALGRATVIGAVFQYIAEWLFNTAGAAQATGQFISGLGDILISVANKLGGFLQVLGVITANPLFGGSGVGNSLKDIGSSLNSWGKNLEKANSEIGMGNNYMQDFTNQVQLADDEMGSLGDSTGGMADNAAAAAQEVRTLLDYSSDLAQVWNRAFDIRFSGQETLDTVTSQFIKIREENERAAKAIRDLRNDIRGLNSDISIQEYYLSIAIEYGDTARAQALEAELAKKRAELADKTAELQKEQDAANKSLVGNSQSAIDNRKTILDLVRGYQSHIEALAASGASEAMLLAETARLKAEFISQATQLGYNRAELTKYATAFDDVSTAIRNVPKNVTVTANADPALQALNELNSRIKQVTNNGSGYSIPIKSTFDDSGYAKSARAAALQRIIAENQAQYARLIAQGRTAQAAQISAVISRYANQLSSGNYYTGGYTGSGGMYEPAGIVHRGEYVIPKRDVNQATGLPYADALGRLMSGQRGYATGGYVRPAASSSQQVPVALSAGTIQQLANAVQKYIVVDGQILGETTSDAYAQSASVGAN